MDGSVSEPVVGGKLGLSIRNLVRIGYEVFKRFCAGRLGTFGLWSLQGRLTLDFCKYVFVRIGACLVCFFDSTYVLWLFDFVSTRLKAPPLRRGRPRLKRPPAPR